MAAYGYHTPDEGRTAFYADAKHALSLLGHYYLDWGYMAKPSRQQVVEALAEAAFKAAKIRDAEAYDRPVWTEGVAQTQDGKPQNQAPYQKICDLLIALNGKMLGVDQYHPGISTLQAELTENIPVFGGKTRIKAGIEELCRPIDALDSNPNYNPRQIELDPESTQELTDLLTAVRAVLVAAEPLRTAKDRDFPSEGETPDQFKISKKQVRLAAAELTRCPLPNGRDIPSVVSMMVGTISQAVGSPGGSGILRLIEVTLGNQGGYGSYNLRELKDCLGDLEYCSSYLLDHVQGLELPPQGNGTVAVESTEIPLSPSEQKSLDSDQTTTDQVQEPAASAELKVEDPLVDYWEQEIDPANWTFEFDGTTLSETEKPVVKDPWEFELLEQVVAEEANTQVEAPAAASPVQQSVPFAVAPVAAPTPPAPAPSPAVTGAFASSVTLEGESLPSSETTRSRTGTGAGLAGTAAAAFAADALTGAVPQAAYQPSPSPPPPAPAAQNTSASPGIANSPPQVAPALTAHAQTSLSEQSTAARPDFTPVVQACANLMGTTIRGIVSTVWSTMCDLIDPNIGGGQSFDTTCKQVFEATKATGEALYSFFQATRQYHAQLARAR